MADDERRAEIEAVARAIDECRPRAAAWREWLEQVAEQAIAALGRVRDARGGEGPPDHQPPHGIPRRRDARGDDVDRQASHREQTIAEMDAARSPQDEDARGDDEVVEALRAAREYIADYSPRDDAGFYDDVVQERLDQMDAALAARSPQDEDHEAAVHALMKRWIDQANAERYIGGPNTSPMVEPEEYDIDDPPAGMEEQARRDVECVVAALSPSRVGSVAAYERANERLEAALLHIINRVSTEGRDDENKHLFLVGSEAVKHARAEMVAAPSRVGSVAVEDGAALIAAERERQMAHEGWTPEHDDEHEDSELLRAALCYAMPSGLRDLIGRIPRSWPWEESHWKPSPNDRVRELVKAGALIAAEIDRLNRSGRPEQPSPDVLGSQPPAEPRKPENG